jgi:uncharacterized protein
LQGLHRPGVERQALCLAVKAGRSTAIGLNRAPSHHHNRTVDLPRYDPQLATEPLTDAELDALDAMLLALPTDNPMNVEALDGYLTALLVGPRSATTLPGAAWMPVVWGGDGATLPAPFSSQKQRKRAAQLVLRHLHTIDEALHKAPARWEPVFSVAEAGEQELADAEDWCIGFLQATELAPEAWGALFEDPRLAPLLAPIALLGGDESLLSPEDAARLADPEQRDALSRAVVDAVLALLAPR